MTDSLWSQLTGFIIIATVLVAFIVIIISSSHLKGDFPSSRLKEKFFKALNIKFDLGLIRDINDINILIDSLQFGRGYSSILLLEEYLQNLLDDPAYQEKKEIIQLKYDCVLKMLVLLKEEKPFSEVPNEERRILSALKEAAVRNDSGQVLSNLNELSSVMIIRNKTYQKTAKLNKTAVPLAIIGLIVTILFGIFSVTNKINERTLKDAIKTTITEMLKK